MTGRSSKEVTAWRPPVGWNEFSAYRRATYLKQRGTQIPLGPADWDTMEPPERMAYLHWSKRFLADTSEARAEKWREYWKEQRAWNVLMCWWMLCLLVGLAPVWGTRAIGEAVGLRVGVTMFVLAAYTMAIFVPMRLTRPDPPSA